VVFWESGFKQFTGNFAIREPADYKGTKIRTMPAPVIQEQFKAFGATPTMINFSELYSALQQKVVDGFFEVQKHLTLSDHGFIAYVFMINKPFLDKLPADQRDVLVSTAREASKHQRQLIQKAEAAHLETFKKAGIEIITLTPEQRGEFEKASRPVYDWYTAKFGTETLDVIRKHVQAK
jgi:C4-dicarboxylate-binding protein DctP